MLLSIFSITVIATTSISATAAMRLNIFTMLVCPYWKTINLLPFDENQRQNKEDKESDIERYWHHVFTNLGCNQPDHKASQQ
jgi:hypothetical protein